MVAVPVNKEVLVWARKERGLSKEEAANRLKLSMEEFEELEGGPKLPSIAMLERIAKKYQIPFASLLMPQPLPPATRLQVADFRTHGGKPPIWDQRLLVAVDVVNIQIEMFDELREHQPQLLFAPAIRNYSMTMNASEVARLERDQFGVTVDQQMAWPSGAQAFRYWRARVERAGIFVQIMNVGPENLCRGFSILDQRNVPVAVINGDESEGPARTFTLLHEYAHLLLRAPGISDQNKANNVERWCNQFAAHFLMPAEQFKVAARSIDASGEWPDARLTELAELFKVSRQAVTLHLEELGFVKDGFYEGKMVEWRKRKRKKGGIPMPYPERQVNRLGVRHLSIVLDALDKRILSPLDAFELTDIDPKHYKEVKTELEERLAKYGGVH